MYVRRFAMQKAMIQLDIGTGHWHMGRCRLPKFPAAAGRSVVVGVGSPIARRPPPAARPSICNFRVLSHDPSTYPANLHSTAAASPSSNDRHPNRPPSTLEYSWRTAMRASAATAAALPMWSPPVRKAARSSIPSLSFYLGCPNAGHATTSISVANRLAGRRYATTATGRALRPRTAIFFPGEREPPPVPID